LSTQALTAVTDRDESATPESVPAPRFEPSDRRAASRQSALRLAREARALPNDARWFYLRALRTAARRDEELRLNEWERPAGIARLLELAEDWERVELVAKLRFDGTAIEDVFVLRQPAPVGRRRDAAHVGIKRGLPAFAFAGVLAGLTAAVLLPSSLSENLPGTTGNGNEKGGGKPGTAGERGRAQALQPRDVAARGGGSSFSRSSNSRSSRSSSSSRPSRHSGSSRSKRRSSSSRPTRRVRRKVAIGLGSFSGTGDTKLGTLRIDRPTILSWSTGGQSFQIASEAWRFHPRQRQGSTVLTPGTYRRFAVKSTTTWKLSLNRAR
jgi:hypothetical protein